ncbi:MAG: hypothetical protein IKZ88_09705 [Neisseriaceae bacterium]|nr:hypothetical protein [Neisseriaceae bacterium]
MDFNIKMDFNPFLCGFLKENGLKSIFYIFRLPENINENVIGWAFQPTAKPQV